jgi:hypothetical protein
MPGEIRKTVKLNRGGIGKVPDDKPVLYKILNQAGENIYTGVAKRGRVRERLAEHLASGQDPVRGGVKAQIEQHHRIADVEQKEKRVIARSKPRQNVKGN